MSIPEFKVGERVECESGANDLSCPRWSYIMDSGGSGKYIQGTVRCIFPRDYLIVDFDKGWPWRWPLYDNTLWGNPGYLRHVSTQNTYQKSTSKLRLVDKGGYYGMEEAK